MGSTKVDLSSESYCTEKGRNGLDKTINVKWAKELIQDPVKIQLTLNLQSTNPLLFKFKAMEYAARGPVIQRAMEIERSLNQGCSDWPFTEVIKANLGDAHAMGQKPLTFVRQVLAAVTCPELIEQSNFEDDIKEKAKRILNECRGRSAGSYSDSRGLEIIRKHTAEYIERRDKGIKSNPENIILCAGASEGIRACLKLFKGAENEQKSGVMTPIPEYPLYSATLGEYNMSQIGYYLNEDNNWSLDVEELERAITEARRTCNPRAIVVINPGNPTGQVLTRQNMEDVIRFAYKEKLFILADEVYQDNIYEDNTFLSFKKVMYEMESPYDSMELASFFSCSKGYVCECGLRGAYFEVVNMDPEVQQILFASVAAKLCPSVVGQGKLYSTDAELPWIMAKFLHEAAVDCIVSPPQPGDPSYALFEREKQAILQNLSERARIVTQGFNSLPGIKCTPVQGAMYSYPQVFIPEKAIKKATEKKMEPDVFYALELLETTGICVVPGSGVGQAPGTYHFRTTILPATEKLRKMMEMFKEFHLKFMANYSA